MCSSRKYPYPPLEGSLEIPREWGDARAKTFKGKYKAKLAFLGKLGWEGGGGGLTWEGCGYFLEYNVTNLRGSGAK